MQRCLHVKRKKDGFDLYQMCNRATSSLHRLCPIHSEGKGITLTDDMCKCSTDGNGICGNEITHTNSKCYYHTMNEQWINCIIKMCVAVNLIRITAYELSFELIEKESYVGVLSALLCYVGTTSITFYGVRYFSNTGVGLCAHEREDGKVCARPTNGKDMYLCEDHLNMKYRSKCMYRRIHNSIHQQWTRMDCMSQKEDEYKLLCDHHDSETELHGLWQYACCVPEFIILCALIFSQNNGGLFKVFAHVILIIMNLVLQLAVIDRHNISKYERFEYSTYYQCFS